MDINLFNRLAKTQHFSFSRNIFCLRLLCFLLYMSMYHLTAEIFCDMIFTKLPWQIQNLNVIFHFSNLSDNIPNLYVSRQVYIIYFCVCTAGNSMCSMNVFKACKRNSTICSLSIWYVWSRKDFELLCRNKAIVARNKEGLLAVNDSCIYMRISLLIWRRRKKDFSHRKSYKTDRQIHALLLYYCHNKQCYACNHYHTSMHHYTVWPLRTLKLAWELQDRDVQEEQEWRMRW